MHSLTGLFTLWYTIQITSWMLPSSLHPGGRDTSLMSHLPSTPPHSTPGVRIPLHITPPDHPLLTPPRGSGYLFDVTPPDHPSPCQLESQELLNVRSEMKISWLVKGTRRPLFNAMISQHHIITHWSLTCAFDLYFGHIDALDLFNIGLFNGLSTSHMGHYVRVWCMTRDNNSSQKNKVSCYLYIRHLHFIVI
jgi:hypothetical protein